MSDPVIRRVRRSIDEAKNRGGMQAGMLKVTIYASDADRLCIMAETLTAAPAAKGEPSRTDLIQCLLATRGQSEGATADAILSMLVAEPVVQGEPVAWIVRHPRFCGKFTDDKEIAAHWENKERGCTAPLYLHAQSAPEVAKLVEALQSLLDMQDQDCRYDHQGYCQNHNLDHIDVGCRVQKARTALAAYRKKWGEA